MSITRGYRDKRGARRYPVKKITVDEGLKTLPDEIQGMTLAITGDFNAMRLHVESLPVENRERFWHLIGKNRIVGDLDEIYDYFRFRPSIEIRTGMTSFRHIVSKKYAHVSTDYLPLFSNLEVLERATVVASSMKDVHTAANSKLREGHVHIDIPREGVDEEQYSKMLAAASNTILTKRKSLSNLKLVLSKGPIHNKCESFIGINGVEATYIASTNSSEVVALSRLINELGGTKRYYLLMPESLAPIVNMISAENPNSQVVHVHIDKYMIIGKSLGKFAVEESPGLAMPVRNRAVLRDTLRQLVLTNSSATEMLPDLTKHIGWLTNSKWFTAEDAIHRTVYGMVKKRGDTPSKRNVYRKQYPWDLLVPEWDMNTTSVYVFALADLF